MCSVSLDSFGIVACQAPLCMGLQSQEYWSGLPFPLPRDLPNPGIELLSHFLHWQADSLPLNHLGSPYLTFHSFSLLLGAESFNHIYYRYSYGG